MVRAGKDSRSDTLVGFYESLGESIEQEARLSASEAGKERIDTNDDKPLRYDSYSTESATSDKGKGKAKPVSERLNELAMERRERGGNGGNMSESLMTAGALALLVEGGRDGDDSPPSDSDEVSFSPFERVRRVLSDGTTKERARLESVLDSNSVADPFLL